jgi:hypothetical protein
VTISSPNPCSSLLQEENQHADYNATSTPYSRISFVYSTVSQGAFNEVGTTHLTSCDDGFMWKLYSSQIRHNGSIVNMRKWSQASQDAINTFTNLLKVLAPDDDIFQEFCHSNLVDVKAREAPHRQPGNQWLQHLQERLLSCLADTQPNEDKEDTAEAWLLSEQDTLKSLLPILCLAGGVSFRAWQYSAIQFDSSENTERNIWILTDGTVIVARPKSKQRHRAHAPTFLAFPHKIYPELQFYLYVIRPVACRILEQFQQDSSQHRVFLWVHFSSPYMKKHKVPQVWTSNEASKLVQTYTKESVGLILSPMLVRQCEQAVFREKLPQFFSKMEHSNSDEKMLECSHYFGFPTHWADMSLVDCARLLAVSQIWQAILSIEPIHQYWSPLVDGFSIFTMDNEDHWPLAFATSYQLLPTNKLQIVQSSTPTSVSIHQK